MKTDLQLLEECIEEKTKEYHRISASLSQIAVVDGVFSFVNTRKVVESFEMRSLETRVRNELDVLLQQRARLLGDITEQEVILSSKEDVLRCLSEQSDGLYRLMKVERKDNGCRE